MAVGYLYIGYSPRIYCSTTEIVDGITVLVSSCAVRCGRGGTGIHDRLKQLSASEETPGVELLKFGEPLTGEADGNPEPSCADGVETEGVETRRAAPNSIGEHLDVRVKG